MQAVSTNQIADILHVNDKTYVYIHMYIYMYIIFICIYR